MKIDDVITKLNLRQSAFCIEIFDADIQIPEISLQALSPFSLFCASIPRELARRLHLWVCPDLIIAAVKKCEGSINFAIRELPLTTNHLWAEVIYYLGQIAVYPATLAVLRIHLTLAMSSEQALGMNVS